MAVQKGTYALVIVLDASATIGVGSLGEFAFPTGFYVYCGSARGGLRQRVERHLRPEKRLRWHIDYLLQHARVVEVWYAEGDEHSECRWARAMQGMSQAQVVAAGFGSSDCRCPSHLIHFPQRPSIRLFRQRLDEGAHELRRASPRGFLSET